MAYTLGKVIGFPRRDAEPATDAVPEEDDDATPPDIPVGTNVILNCGGPLLTVTAQRENVLQVIWSVQGALYEREVDVRCVIIV